MKIKEQNRVNEVPARITLKPIITTIDPIDPNLVAVIGDHVMLAGPGGMEIAGSKGCQFVDLDCPVSRLVSDGHRAVALSRVQDHVDILSIDSDGRVDTLTQGLIDVSDIALIGDWVGCLTGLNHPGGAGVLFVDATGQPTQLVSLPIGREAGIEASGKTVIVYDRKCCRWWRIRPGDCAVVTEGDCSTIPPEDDDDVVARPNGEIDRPGSIGCGTRVSHTLGRLYNVNQGLVAQSPDRRHISLIDRKKLLTVAEYQFGVRGAQLHYDLDRDQLVAFDLERLLLLFFDIGLIFADPIREDSGGIPTGDEAVFIGRTSQPLIADRASAVGDHRILAVPLIEPGQTIGTTEDIPRYIQEEVIEPLSAYYRNASGDRLRIDGDVYGFEAVADDQGPLPLVNRFDRFWNGAIEAGGFRVRIPDVAQPFEIFFDGTEELVVELNDPGRSLVDHTLTIIPSTGRVVFDSLLSSSGSGTVSFGPASTIVVQTEVDGVVQNQGFNLPPDSYRLPADLGRLQDDLTAVLDSTTIASPDHRLRLVARIHRSNLLFDLHFANSSAVSRRLAFMEVRSDLSFRQRISSFAFSTLHGLREFFDLENALQDAALVAELDAGFNPISSASVQFRVDIITGSVRTRAQARDFGGNLRFIEQQRLDILGFNPPSGISRGFQGSVLIPDEAPPLRFDGSEHAEMRTERGARIQLRIPALYGSSSIPPADDLDFDGVSGTVTIDGEARTLTFPTETIASNKSDLEAYLERVLASAGLPPADRLVPEVQVDASGILSVRLYFDQPLIAGRSPRQITLMVTDTINLPAFQLGLGSMSPLGQIRLDNTGGLVDDLTVVVEGLPFEAPMVTRSGFDLLVEFTFDSSQAGNNNQATVTSQRGLDRFGFNSAEPVRGNNVAPGRQFAPYSFRDSDEGLGLGTDLLTALHDRHGSEVGDIIDQISGYQSVALVLIGEPPPTAGWTSSEVSLLSAHREFASGSNVASRHDNAISLDTNCYTVHLHVTNDLPTTCHEFGHAIGFYDLYPIEGVHRPDLNYLEQFCLMHSSDLLNTISGYHKLGAGWVSAPVRAELGPGTTEALLVPLEYGDLADQAAVRAVFDGSDLPINSLIRIGLGGGAAPFGLVEARQRQGTKYGRRLAEDGQVLVTHCLDHSDDTRLRDTNGYRRQAHMITSPLALRNPGDQVELGAASTLSIGGTRIEVVDRRSVASGSETFNVFHVAVHRREAQILDLFFDHADPPWKAPDAWVDDPMDEDGREIWAIGEPRHQGDTIRVPSTTGVEIPHKLLARVHNGSPFDVPRADVAFYLCKPPGSGDSGNFIRVGNATAVDIPAGGTAQAELDWLVVFGDNGHQCLRVELFDWELPDVPDGHPGFTDDIVEENNRAQKNFDHFQSVSGSPYEPIRFQYSVANDGPFPELVRLQADQLSPGMEVRVQPAHQWVAPDDVVVFDCTLQLDIEIIPPDCHWDREYALSAWRRSGDSWERWGGCQYLVSPRKKTTISLEGSLGYGRLQISGAVTPSPGRGRVELQMVTNRGTPPIERVGVTAGGRFRYDHRDVGADIDWIRTVARFEGYDSWGSSTSEEITLHHAKLI